MDWPTAAQLSMAAAVTIAYAVFGLTGFGSAMVAVPALVQFMPLDAAVPLVLLLDLVSTAVLGASNRQQVRGREIARLFPFMLVGVAVGVLALTNVAPKLLLTLLGTFVIANSAWNLFGAPAAGRVRAAWAAPAGVAGGIFSALFGTGGPVYVSYLARRIDEAGALRATIASVILVSAVVRLGTFAAAGLYHAQLLLATLALLPFCALGAWSGGRLHGRLPLARAKTILFSVLLVAGLAVLARAAAL